MLWLGIVFGAELEISPHDASNIDVGYVERVLRDSLGLAYSRSYRSDVGTNVEIILEPC